MQYITVQYTTLQCSPVHYSTVSTMQYNLYNLECHAFWLSMFSHIFSKISIKPLLRRERKGLLWCQTSSFLRFCFFRTYTGERKKSASLFNKNREIYSTFTASMTCEGSYQVWVRTINIHCMYTRHSLESLLKRMPFTKYKSKVVTFWTRNLIATLHKYFSAFFSYFLPFCCW